MTKDVISNSLYNLLYNSYEGISENLVMDQIILPKFFILVLLTYRCQSVKIILKNT